MASDFSNPIKIMSKTPASSDFLEENETQLNDDQFIDADLMEQMLQETFEASSQDPSFSSSEELSTYPVKIVLGTVQISDETRQQYTPGDLIVLEQPSSTPVTLITQKGQTFKGKLGQIKKNYALRLIKS